jgi:hypothetical protein
MNKLLDMAIKDGKAKEYYGAYIIYPKLFMSDYVLNALLGSMKNDYDFYHIMDAIKAVKKS